MYKDFCVLIFENKQNQRSGILLICRSDSEDNICRSILTMRGYIIAKERMVVLCLRKNKHCVAKFDKFKSTFQIFQNISNIITGYNRKRF